MRCLFWAGIIEATRIPLCLSARRCCRDSKPVCRRTDLRPSDMFRVGITGT